jgi:hypothetical protein
MQSESNKQKTVVIESSLSEIYDLYAPAVYGKILGIVHEVPIADKIFKKVFLTALQTGDLFVNTSRPPLISLLNQSRKKCYQTINALNIFTECCAGSSVSIAEKNSIIGLKPF